MKEKEIAVLIYSRYDKVFMNDDNKRNASIEYCKIAKLINEKEPTTINVVEFNEFWDRVITELKTLTYKRPAPVRKNKTE